VGFLLPYDNDIKLLLLAFHQIANFASARSRHKACTSASANGILPTATLGRAFLMFLHGLLTMAKG